MNTKIVNSIPPGYFEEISIDFPDWQAHFLKLIRQWKQIKYDVHAMPNLSQEIQSELSKRNYCDLILESDKDQHFLIPGQVKLEDRENQILTFLYSSKFQQSVTEISNGIGEIEKVVAYFCNELCVYDLIEEKPDAKFVLTDKGRSAARDAASNHRNI